MDDLKRRQEAGEQVEDDMLDFLMQFTPAGELRLCDAKQIAAFARTRAFELFSQAATE